MTLGFYKEIVEQRRSHHCRQEIAPQDHEDAYQLVYLGRMVPETQIPVSLGHIDSLIALNRSLYSLDPRYC
jgi:hypothetical protein